MGFRCFRYAHVLESMRDEAARSMDEHLPRGDQEANYTFWGGANYPLLALFVHNVRN